MQAIENRPHDSIEQARALPLATTDRIERMDPKRAAWQAHLREMLDELRGLYDNERETLLAQGLGAPNWKDGHVWPWQE